MVGQLLCVAVSQVPVGLLVLIRLFSLGLCFSVILGNWKPTFYSPTTIISAAKYRFTVHHFYKKKISCPVKQCLKSLTAGFSAVM